MNFSGEGLFLLEEQERKEREEDIADMKGGEVGTPLVNISKRWVVVETEKDGDCFFNTMASGIILARQSGARFGNNACKDVPLLSKASVKPCANALRKLFAAYVVDLLIDETVLAQPYVAEETTATLRDHIRNVFKKEPTKYVEELSRPGTWATELEFGLFASFNKVCIHVLSKGVTSITGIYGDRSNPVFYVFADGAHFELLLPYRWFVVAYQHIKFDNSPGKAIVGEFIPEKET